MGNTEKEKGVPIIFKVSAAVNEKIKVELAEKKIKMTEFMRTAVEQYFNPITKVEYVDKIVEVPVERVVEVEKKVEVFVDRVVEKTVHVPVDKATGELLDERTLVISEKLYSEIEQMRSNPEKPVIEVMIDYMWNKIKYAKNPQAFSKTTLPSNSTAPHSEVNTTTPPTAISGEAKFGLFEDYKRRKREDCFCDEDWIALKQEIQNDPNLNPKQKKILIEYN